MNLTLKTLKTCLTNGLMAVAGGALLAGCASGSGSMILPTTVNNNQTQWKTYADAKLAFDSVTVEKTRDEKLHQMGFDAASSPNVKVLNYVDVVNLFGSSFTFEQLPEGIKQCVKAREGCTGYVVAASDIKNKRDGNIAADLFGFRRQTHVTGWSFSATFVLINDLVVYKLWNGQPNIETYERQVTPLGPMQSLGGLIPKPF